MTSSDFDAVKAEAFADRMLGTLNESFTALMVSIGNQTGLFDAMGELPPATSDEIAKAAGLNERYVREWLGATVTAKVVEYDPESKQYRLPPEHAAALTTAAGSGNLATQMLWVSCMGEVEQQVVDAFRRGGGVPYSAYERFHRIMTEVSGQTFDETLTQRTLPLVPGLVEQLERGIQVLDVACGSGHAINVMARAYPKSRFTGYDFSKEGIEAGQRKAEAWGLDNATFAVQDVAEMRDVDRFDFITAFDAIHDQARPRRVLSGIATMLRPEGTFLMVDINASSALEDNLEHPFGPFFYAVSTMHCMTVSLALDGEGLGAVWGEQKARELLAEAGFAEPEVHQVPGDMFNSFYIAKLR
jgi:2-polyprenyl-3-methyl-5-hydroxy-6-metoxy-1,4-benzoquinol methylase